MEDSDVRRMIREEILRYSKFSGKKIGDTPIDNFDLTNKKYVLAQVATVTASGVTGSVLLAKLTPGGTQGSLTFTKGIITAFSAPT